MYRFRPPSRYPRMVIPRQRLGPRLTLQEQLWRRRWPRVLTILLAILMLVFIAIIFALEITSLAIDSSSTLSNTASTGAGIWCSIGFLVPIVAMGLLRKRFITIFSKHCIGLSLVFVCKCSTRWSTYTLAAHLLALVFICILIALDANAVTPYNQMVSSAPKKIQVLKGQLAMAILMILFPIAFLAIYIYTAFVSRLPPRAQRVSIRPPRSYPVRVIKY